jgi:hypothetical protein
MRLPRIDNIEDATNYLPRFMAQYNQRFARPPRIDLDAHRKVLHTEQELDLLLSFQDERAISKNLEVRLENSVYQLQAAERRRRLSGKRAVVHKHDDGRISILVAGELAPQEHEAPLRLGRGLAVYVRMRVFQTQTVEISSSSSEIHWPPAHPAASGDKEMKSRMRIGHGFDFGPVAMLAERRTTSHQGCMARKPSSGWCSSSNSRWLLVASSMTRRNVS